MLNVRKTEEVRIDSGEAKAKMESTKSIPSDPLYIIHSITSTLALQGPDLLDRLANFLRPHGLSSSDEMDESNAEEDALEIAAKRKTPRHAKEATMLLSSEFDTAAFSALCAEAGALSLLLRLKSFLRKAYNLSEARCLQYNPEARDLIGEKSTSRNTSFDFDSKLPMQSSISGKEDEGIDGMVFQYAEFRVLMRAEANVGAAMEGDEEHDDDDDSNVSAGKRKRADSDEMEEEG